MKVLFYILVFWGLIWYVCKQEREAGEYRWKLKKHGIDPDKID